MKEIDKNFPFNEYRPHQKETILKMLAKFDKVDNIILESPVGTGKSVLAVTLSNLLGRSYYLTIQRILQDQIINDFRSQGMVELKGRSNYECWFLNRMAQVSRNETAKFLDEAEQTGRKLNLDREDDDEDEEYEEVEKRKYYANKGRCVRKGKSFLKGCIDKNKCAYKNQIDAATFARHSVFNFSSFLYQRRAGRFGEERDLLVIDEAHQIEPQIMDYVDVTIDGSDIGQALPEYETALEYRDYFEQVGLTKIIAGHMMQAESDEDIDEMEKWTRIQGKYNTFKLYVEHVDCVAELKKNVVTIKPLYATYHAPRLLLPAGRRRLFMSATILNPRIFGDSIGLDPEKTAYITVPHTFPVANRPIHLDYAGSMKFSNRKKTMPAMIKKIDKIMTKHKGERGIIHCQSFGIMDAILSGLSSKNKRRIIDQREYRRREEVLATQSISTDSVIMAPAMHEGLDLKGDLSRFQILMKVPYPDASNNKQLKVRMNESWQYYLWLTALKFVQSYGRSIRAQDDWAETYILDSDFDRFYGMADRFSLLPDWFVEAIQV